MQPSPGRHTERKSEAAADASSSTPWVRLRRRAPGPGPEERGVWGEGGRSGRFSRRLRTEQPARPPASPPSVPAWPRSPPFCFSLSLLRSLALKPRVVVPLRGDRARLPCARLGPMGAEHAQSRRRHRALVLASGWPSQARLVRHRAPGPVGWRVTGALTPAAPALRAPFGRAPVVARVRVGLAAPEVGLVPGRDGLGEDGF